MKLCPVFIQFCQPRHQLFFEIRNSSMFLSDLASQFTYTLFHTKTYIFHK